MNFKELYPLKECPSIFKALGFSFTDYTPEQLGFMLYNQCASRDVSPMVEEMLDMYTTPAEVTKGIASYLSMKLGPVWTSIKSTYEIPYDVLAVTSKETVTDKTNGGVQDTRTTTNDDSTYGFDSVSAIPTDSKKNVDSSTTTNNKDRTYTMETTFQREDIPSKLIRDDRKFKTETFIAYVIESITKEMVIDVY